MLTIEILTAYAKNPEKSADYINLLRQAMIQQPQLFVKFLPFLFSLKELPQETSSEAATLIQDEILHFVVKSKPPLKSKESDEEKNSDATPGPYEFYITQLLIQELKKLSPDEIILEMLLNRNPTLAGKHPLKPEKELFEFIYETYPNLRQLCLKIREHTEAQKRFKFCLEFQLKEVDPDSINISVLVDHFMRSYPLLDFSISEYEDLFRAKLFNAFDYVNDTSPNTPENIKAFADLNVLMLRLGGCAYFKETLTIAIANTNPPNNIADQWCSTYRLPTGSNLSSLVHVLISQNQISALKKMCTENKILELQINAHILLQAAKLGHLEAAILALTRTTKQDHLSLQSLKALEESLLLDEPGKIEVAYLIIEMGPPDLFIALSEAAAKTILEKILKHPNWIELALCLLNSYGFKATKHLTQDYAIQEAILRRVIQAPPKSTPDEKIHRYHDSFFDEDKLKKLINILMPYQHKIYWNPSKSEKNPQGNFLHCAIKKIFALHQRDVSFAKSKYQVGVALQFFLNSCDYEMSGQTNDKGETPLDLVIKFYQQDYQNIPYELDSVLYFYLRMYHKPPMAFNQLDLVSSLEKLGPCKLIELLQRALRAQQESLKKDPSYESSQKFRSAIANQIGVLANIIGNNHYPKTFMGHENVSVLQMLLLMNVHEEFIKNLFLSLPPHLEIKDDKTIKLMCEHPGNFATKPYITNSSLKVPLLFASFHHMRVERLTKDLPSPNGGVKPSFIRDYFQHSSNREWNPTLFANGKNHNLLTYVTPLGPEKIRAVIEFFKAFNTNKATFKLAINWSWGKTPPALCTAIQLFKNGDAQGKQDALESILLLLDEGASFEWNWIKDIELGAIFHPYENQGKTKKFGFLMSTPAEALEIETDSESGSSLTHKNPR